MDGLAFPFALLRSTIDLYKRNASLIAGYAAWLLLPFLGLVALSFLPKEHAAVSAGMLVLSMIQAAIWLWVTIVIIRATALLAKGKKPDPLKIQAEGWQLLPPVLLVVVLQLVALIGGLILLVIPGLVFFVWFAFAQVAAVVDGKRSVEALSYSRGLVAGRFLKAAWYVTAGPLALVFLYAFVLAIVTYAGLAGGLTELPPEASAQFLAEPPMWLLVVDTLGDVFILTPLLPMYSTLLYLHMKKTYGPTPRTRHRA